MNIGKDVFVGETSFAHQFHRLRRYVEILLSARFLLSENDSGKFPPVYECRPKSDGERRSVVILSGRRTGTQLLFEGIRTP